MKEYYKGLLIVEDDEIPFGLEENEYIYRSQIEQKENVPAEDMDTLEYLEWDWSNNMEK